jgi:hypothetical protein
MNKPQIFIKRDILGHFSWWLDIGPRSRFFLGRVEWVTTSGAIIRAREIVLG